MWVTPGEGCDRAVTGEQGGSRDCSTPRAPGDGPGAGPALSPRAGDTTASG